MLNNLYMQNKKYVFSNRCNTINAVSIILQNGNEISLYEYEEGMLPYILKISNEALREGDNEILIYIPGIHMMRTDMVWQQTSQYMRQIQADRYLIHYEKGMPVRNDVSDDYSGYQTCDRLIRSMHKSIEDLDAVEYCRYRTGIAVSRFNGYLPAVGQMRIIVKYQELINYILEQLGGSRIEFKDTKYWTSNEWGTDYAWCIDDGIAKYTNKNNQYNVLPLFKKIIRTR